VLPPGAAWPSLARAYRIHAVRPLHGGATLSRPECGTSPEGASRRRLGLDDLDDRVAASESGTRMLDLSRLYLYDGVADGGRRGSACSPCRSCASWRWRGQAHRRRQRAQPQHVEPRWEGGVRDVGAMVAWCMRLRIPGVGLGAIPRASARSVTDWTPMGDAPAHREEWPRTSGRGDVRGP